MYPRQIMLGSIQDCPVWRLELARTMLTRAQNCHGSAQHCTGVRFENAKCIDQRWTTVGFEEKEMRFVVCILLLAVRSGQASETSKGWSDWLSEASHSATPETIPRQRMPSGKRWPSRRALPLMTGSWSYSTMLSPEPMQRWASLPKQKASTGSRWR